MQFVSINDRLIEREVLQEAVLRVGAPSKLAIRLDANDGEVADEDY